jgi:hypothetical protein
MDVREAVGRIRDAVIQVQQSGQQFVAISPLLEFLQSVELQAPLDSETRKLQHDSNLAQYRAKVDNGIEMLRSVLDTAKTALTTSILVNGGATVALLAFLGNIIGKTPSVPEAMWETLVLSVVFFACGVLAGAIATGSTYLAQYCYHEDWKRSGIGFHITTIAFVFASYLTFLGGVISAYHALIQ